MIMYVYLHKYRSIEGYVNLTIKDFILYYNFVPNRNKGRINEKVYSTLRLMIDREFIRFIGCFSNGGLASLSDVDCNMMFTVQLINIDEKWNPQSRFTKILYSEIDTLRENNVKPIDKILCLYINIKKRISADAEAGNANMFAFPSEETLAREGACGVSTIKNYTHILCGIGMLYVKNYGSYIRMKKGREVVVNSNNVYALEEKYLDNNAKEGLKEYLKLSCGYVDGFYPPCNNLPNNKKKSGDSMNVSDDQWGETDSMDKDFSIEEMLDMPTVNDIKSNPKVSEMNMDKTVEATNTTITNPVKVITIKKPAQKDNVVPDDVIIQRYADNLYKEQGNECEKSLFILELAEKFPGIDDYEKYWDRAKSFFELNVL